MPLMKISEYRQTFTPASRPDQRTVIAWIKRGEIYGERRGKIWYVDPTRPTDQATPPQTPPAAAPELGPLARKVLGL